MTTYEDLVAATLRHGLMPLVVPQLKTITLGGAVSGLGIESTSLRNGMPHESVLAMEILTGDGQVVTATADGEHAALYRGFPNSYGTLGYTLSLTIELEPVKPYVHLRHFRFTDPAECFAAVAQVVADGSYEGHQADFIDGTAFSQRGDVPDHRGVQRRRALAERLHARAHLLPVAARAARGLPHHQRLPVAVGHRLVLVLTAVRRAAPGDPGAVAAALPSLRRLPQAGRPGPQARRHAQARCAPRPARDRNGDPGRRNTRG